MGTMAMINDWAVHFPPALLCWVQCEFCRAAARFGTFNADTSRMAVRRRDVIAEGTGSPLNILKKQNVAQETTN